MLDASSSWSWVRTVGRGRAQSEIELCIGPVEFDLRRLAHSDRDAFELLEAAWLLAGEELAAEFQRTQPGSRPWGWWAWEAEEERPSFSAGAMAELARLVELDELEHEEIETIFARSDSRLGSHEESFPHGVLFAVAQAVALDRLLGGGRYAVSQHGDVVRVRAGERRPRSGKRGAVGCPGRSVSKDCGMTALNTALCPNYSPIMSNKRYTY